MRSGTPPWTAALLAAACLVTYWLTTRVLGAVYLLSRDDDLIGGLWAVIATIFVLPDSYQGTA